VVRIWRCVNERVWLSIRYSFVKPYPIRNEHIAAIFFVYMKIPIKALRVCVCVCVFVCVATRRK
jgi:hypothetical protein